MLNGMFKQFTIFILHFILVCPCYLDLRQKLIKKFYFYKPSVFKLIKLLSINNVKELCRLENFLAHLSWKLKWAFLITYRPSSVCLSVRPSVRLSVNFSHFLLLQNHWANFNQTWHRASLGEGYSSLFKWRIVMWLLISVSIHTAYWNYILV